MLRSILRTIPDVIIVVGLLIAAAGLLWGVGVFVFNPSDPDWHRVDPPIALRMLVAGAALVVTGVVASIIKEEM